VDRDETAILLAVLVCGAVLWLAGGVGAAREHDDETSAWRQLWLPAIPAAIPFFVLLGWAVSDPEGPETLGVTRRILLVPFAFVWTRALVRAARSAFRREEGPAATEGLLRPRIVMSAAFREALTPEELRAAEAHEQAHVRHRDPLRIWLGRVLTDLQWPIGRASARQRVWMRALELARDDEAVVQRGASPLDLASAIVIAAKLGSTRAPVPRAALGDDAAFLEARVRRLLGSTGRAKRPRSSSLLLLVTACLAIGAFLAGMLVAGPIVTIVAGSP
jgi:hypothetical protein